MNDRNVKIVLFISCAVFVFVILAAILAKIIEPTQDNSKSTNTENIEVTATVDSSVFYSKYGISFTYPSNYKITGEEVDNNGLLSLCCEVKGGDISQIEITTFTYDIFVGLSEKEIKSICVSTLESVEEELRGNFVYKNSVFSDVLVGTIGNIPCYQKTFSCTFLDFSSSGSIKASILEQGRMLITISLYENGNYKYTLDQIEKSISFE